MAGLHNPQDNHLLAALSPAARERIYPQLQLIEMSLGKVLYEPGDLLRHVYFPVDCIVSLLYVMEDGGSAEISVVGNEGLIGIALFMGGETTPSRAVVQSAGLRLQLIGQKLKDEFHRTAACRFCCCVTHKPSSRRCPRLPSATDIIRLISNYADGCSVSRPPEL